MKQVYILLISILLTGCASTHSLLVYKVGCKTSSNFLNEEIKDKDFEFSKIEDFQLCSDFKRYEIIRNNITHIHLDGRKFKMDKVSRTFYAKYDKERCELTVVTPWDGRVEDFEDTNDILNRYYYGPLISKISNPAKKDIIYSSYISFESEDDFKEYCK